MVEEIEEHGIPDFAALLVGMEERLCDRFDILSVQLEGLAVLQPRKKAHFSSVLDNTMSRSTATPVLPRSLTNGSVQECERGLIQDAQQSTTSSTKITGTPVLQQSPSIVVLPQSLGESSEAVPKSVWKKFGTKPSEAAKEFIRDALTNTQKKSIMRQIQERDISDGAKAAPAIPGIDLIVDMKDTRTGGCTESTSCWWNTHENGGMFLEVALRKAEQIKSSVHELLLTKGWVTNTRVGISSKKNSDRDMLLSCAERLVESTKFEMVCAIMIISNAFFLGYQTQYRANPENDGRPLAGQSEVQICFTIWFVVEVLLRLYAYRLGFFMSRDWKWNVFDFVVVSVSVVELSFQEESSSGNSGSSLNSGGVRVIRILRLVRVVRFIRVVRFFAELRMMIYSTLKAVKPFFWALCILFMIIYMFAIVCCQNVSEHRRDHPDSDLTEMLWFFGSMPETVYTLFMVISGGINWGEPAEELKIIHWSFAIWMSLYVSFVVFAVLNIVTGIFIESAFASAQDDQDVVIQDAINQEDGLAHSFLEVFNQFDDDKSGYITFDEFDKHMSDHRVRAFLHHLGLDVNEARGLFSLLDMAGTGRVYAKEFVMGCQQLKGPAKNVDVATLMFQNKRMMALWAVFMSFVEDQFAVLTQPTKKSESASASTQRSGSGSTLAKTDTTALTKSCIDEGLPLAKTDTTAMI